MKRTSAARSNVTEGLINLRPRARSITRPDLVAACLSERPLQTVLTEDWILPVGAYGTGGGPL